MEIFDLFQLVGYFAAFWLFLFSPDFRRERLGEFREAGAGGRCALVVEGAVATFCGLLPLAALGLLLEYAT